MHLSTSFSKLPPQNTDITHANNKTTPSKLCDHPLNEVQAPYNLLEQEVESIPPPSAAFNQATSETKMNKITNCDISNINCIAKIWKKLEKNQNLRGKIEQIDFHLLETKNNQMLSSDIIILIKELKRLKIINSGRTDDNLAELLSLLKAHLKAAWSRITNDEQCSVLNNNPQSLYPGTQKDKLIELNVKAGLNVNSLNISGEAGYVHHKKMDVDDEGVIYDSKGNGFVVKGSVGAEIGIGSKQKVKTGIKGTVSNVESVANVYLNPKEYYDKNSPYQGWADFNDEISRPWYKSVAKRFHSTTGIPLGSNLKKHEYYQQAALGSTTRLNELIAKKLQIYDQQIETPIAQLSTTIKASCSSHISDIKGEAKIGLWGGNISGTHHKMDIKILPPVSFIDMIKVNPNSIKQIPKEWFKLANDLYDKSSSINIDTKLLLAHQELNVLAKDYLELVGKYDWSKSQGNKFLTSQLKSEKKVFEQKAGAIGRHHMLICLQASSAWLASEKGQNNHHQAILFQAESLQKLLASPPILHSPERIQDLFNFEGKIDLGYTENKYSLNGDAEIIKGEIALTKRSWTIPNPLRHGVFLDLTLTLGSQIGVKELTSIIKHLNTNDKDLQEALAVAEPSLSYQGNLGIGAEGTVFFRWFKPHVKKEGDKNCQPQWQFQLVRIINGKFLNRGIEVSIPSGALSISPRINTLFKNHSVIKELIGAQSLNYPMMRYHRFLATDNSEGWNSFVIEQQASFSEMFCNLASTSSTITNNTQKIFTDAESYIKKNDDTFDFSAFKDNFIITMRDHRDAKNNPETPEETKQKLFNKALNALEMLFKFHKDWLSKKNMDFVVMPFSAKYDSAYDLGSKFKQRFKTHSYTIIHP